MTDRSGKAAAEEQDWQRGYGVVVHSAVTQELICSLADRLVQVSMTSDRSTIFRTLAAADRLANAGMWLVAHMTYARRVDPTGRILDQGDFKVVPEGHTGGSLNMVSAYVGYLVANVLSAQTRSWIMRQGHCVATFATMFSPGVSRIIITRSRPEPMLGLLRPLDAGLKKTVVVGFVNKGGTLDVDGMLFASRCTWAHVVAAAARLLELVLERVLDKAEVEAISGHGDPSVLRQNHQLHRSASRPIR